MAHFLPVLHLHNPFTASSSWLSKQFQCRPIISSSPGHIIWSSVPKDICTARLVFLSWKSSIYKLCWDSAKQHHKMKADFFLKKQRSVHVCPPIRPFLPLQLLYIIEWYSECFTKAFLRPQTSVTLGMTRGGSIGDPKAPHACLLFRDSACSLVILCADPNVCIKILDESRHVFLIAATHLSVSESPESGSDVLRDQLNSHRYRSMVC